MTPTAALRKLEEIIRGNVLWANDGVEAENCLSVLWEHVLLGKKE